MRLFLLLTCGACGSYARVPVQGEVCSDHIHLRLDDPGLAAWFNSHLMPSFELEVLP